MIKKILYIVPSILRGRIWLMLALLAASALAEGVTIAVLGSLTGIISNESARGLQMQPLFSMTNNFVSHMSLAGFSIVSLVIVTISIGLRLGSQIYIANCGQTMLKIISSRIFRNYLLMPYEENSKRQSSREIRHIIGVPQTFVDSIVVPSATLFGNIIGVVVVFGLLFVVNFNAAVIVIAVMLFLYLTINKALKSRLSEVSTRLVTEDERRYFVVTEALGGLKEIKILAAFESIFERFELHASEFSSARAKRSIYAMSPTFFIEWAIFIGVICVLLIFKDAQHSASSGGGSFEEYLPMATIILLAVLRLRSMVGGISQGVSTLRTGSGIVNNLYDVLLVCDKTEAVEEQANTAVVSIKKLALQNVGYHYKGAPEPVLTSVSLTISEGDRINIVGASGSGKTTLLDIISGLLTPIHGNVYINDKPVKANKLQYASSAMAYVPQHIFLRDCSIAENIAMTFGAAEIDMSRVIQAAKFACLHEFIETNLPAGYDSVTGERGAALSGGQRQRLGLARALYSDPDLLILDEATSALDKDTEMKVLQNVISLREDRPLILISHSDAVKHFCNRTVYLTNGVLRESIEKP